MRYRISALEVQNVKRIEDVKICPDADSTVVYISGSNGQGKSSIIDALTMVFGGKKAQPGDPVRHGAEEAGIRVKLNGGEDDGELSISRVIQPDGASVLEVRDSLGAVKAPQALLDKLIGARFLDPIASLALPAKEQRASLMRLIDGADRIAGLDEKRGRHFLRRTEVGRDLDKAKGELARLPEVTAGTAIDVDMLNLDTQRAVEQRVANERFDWLERWRGELTRPMRHRGNHRYTWMLDRRRRREVPYGPERAYPKKAKAA